MNAIQNDYQATVENFDQKEEERVKKFQDAVRRQLVKLVGYMNRLGSKRASDGFLSLSYGELFEAARFFCLYFFFPFSFVLQVQNDMATLSGTLKTAKRMGVVTWEGPETLFQTADDEVEIILLQSDEDADFQPLVHEKVWFFLFFVLFFFLLSLG
jgi:hypothetical protein